MFATLDFRSRSPCIEALLVGWALFMTGCASTSIDKAEDGRLQSIDQSTLHPVTGCYSYAGEEPNCKNCGPAPFFPFPVGLKDDPPGELTHLGGEGRENNKDESLEADSICLRTEGDHSIQAIAYQRGKPVAKKRYEGEVRKDEYYIIDSYTQVKMGIPILPVFGQGKPAFAVSSNGDLFTVEVKSGVILLVFFPIFGTNYTESTRFEKVSNPRRPSKSNQSGL